MKQWVIKGHYDVVAFWQREIFDLKVVKYLDESKSLKHSRIFASVN